MKMNLTWLSTVNLKEQTRRSRTLTLHFIILSVTGLVELSEHHCHAPGTSPLAADRDGVCKHLSFSSEVVHTAAERREGFPQDFGQLSGFAHWRKVLKQFQFTSFRKPKAYTANASESFELGRI